MCFVGTGKTTTLVTFVGIEVKTYNKRVLVTAQSHVVVDHIMRLYIEKFGADPRLIRLGPWGRIPADLLPYTPNILLWGRETFNNALENTPVVFTTLASAVTHFSALNVSPFDVAVVDESSVVMEAMMWSPILVSRRLVILGDPKQLSPMVHSNQPELAVTMFDRLMSLYPVVFTMLNTQYRMCPELIRWPNEEFYQGQIITPDVPRTKLQQTPIVCISSPNNSEFSGGRRGSKANIWEVLKVEAIMTELASQGVDVSMYVAVISPYNYQVRLLQRLLTTPVEVSSIDAFQVGLK